MIKKQVIGGEVYYPIGDISTISGVNPRTLQRWINAGDLDNFLTRYQTDGGANYYRLGPPLEDDEQIKSKYRIFKMPNLDK